MKKLICASNDNKVLYDFFTTGKYDKNREFHLTISPSMDILISSNLERLIYRIAGNDAEKNAAFMKSLRETGEYEVTPEMREGLKDFYGNFATEAETEAEIGRLYKEADYIIDTHTAVASAVYGKFVTDTKDADTKTVIASTASPYKFTRSVMRALDKDDASLTDLQLTDKLHEVSGVAIPPAIEEIKSAPVLHDNVIEKDEMETAVKGFLGI